MNKILAAAGMMLLGLSAMRPASAQDSPGGRRLPFGSGARRMEAPDWASRLQAFGAKVESDRDERGQQFSVITWGGSDDGLELLSSVRDLRWLDAGLSTVTDAGAAKLARIKQL